MVNCKWCNSLDRLESDSDVSSDWKRWQCKGCGTFGYVVEPTIDELSKIYNSAWDEETKNGEFATGGTDSTIALSILKSAGYALTNSGPCLDYGGGKGNFARVLSEHGREVTVYEPYGDNPFLPGKVQWLDSINNIPEKKFKWIFMIEVIEHLLDPITELENLYNKLASGGKILITTPNALGWRARVDKLNWREVKNLSHINLFTESTLKNILKDTGYVNIKRIYRPVTYEHTGVKAMVLACTQLLGIDGGLRMIAEKKIN
jgi:2-polyprenyl-3-methyl-5-hydroxy-6-metoxy-1,4-benzoquinol methylase